MLSVRAAFSACGASLPEGDLDFLRDLTRDFIKASSVRNGSTGSEDYHVTNTCGFTLITPGKESYFAYWLRDLSMSADCGLISRGALSNHVVLACKAQNGAREWKMANGMHVPPWAIPDHVNYDGNASFFPGTYAAGVVQSKGTWGLRRLEELPPAGQ